MRKIRKIFSIIRYGSGRLIRKIRYILKKINQDKEG